ncbi:MAG: BCCT family transporter, partial [Leptospira sp.]|nr:BCCT family transporter [Leptospira sp.]
MKNKKYLDIHPPVFIPSLLLIILFISVTLIVGKPMADIFESTKNFITDKTGWLFILGINTFLVFSIYLGFSKYGSIRLGGSDAEPEFSKGAWFAMLFSAGMGIGLVFWGVAEPVTHYATPPFAKGYTVESAQRAMNLSFLHWGFHAWGVYAIVALALAFFSFNKNLPLSIRSVFYPLLGDRIKGRIGDVIDILAVLATLFGLATSLGLGVKQINGGLAYLFDIPNNANVQVIIITIVTLIATISVFSGIGNGVRILSEWNMRFAALLLLFVFIVGPTLFILKGFVQNIGNYFNHFIEVSFWSEAYRDNGWQVGWTIFYWAWWVAWSPFVGMFIARISMGRTIREFIFGVLLVPTFLTFLWLTVFGGSAIYLDMQDMAATGSHAFAEQIAGDLSTTLFVFLERFPFSFVGSIIGVLLVASFFVTSSDSGSLVIDSITAGGKTDA